MANTDKNQAVIDFLMTCPVIRANLLYFNFLNAKDKSKQIITVDTPKNQAYIDGSVPKQYMFSIVDFQSVTYQPIPINTVVPGTTEMTQYVSENVTDMQLVQGILDWVNEQNDLQNYPDFGKDCQIDEMKTTTNIPRLNGVDTQVTPALAKYSITIQIDYLDMSKMLWK